MRYDTTEIAVCTVCICLLANGEYVDGTDAAERAGEGMARIWGDDGKYLSPGSEDLGYGMSSCGGCGETDHGDRHQAFAMIPVKS